MEQKYCMCCMEALEKITDRCPHCGSETSCSNPQDCLESGTLLHDRYLLGRILGKGGFGITYLARDLFLDIKVAVKEYYPEGLVFRCSTLSSEVAVRDPEDQEAFAKGQNRFLREARTLAGFGGLSNIVWVRDVFTENGTSYIVMEYVEGVTLARYQKEQGNLSFSEVFRMLEPVMETLQKIHEKGMIHRDISPGNLMLQPNGKVKLIDFGATRSYEDPTKSQSLVLKPGYAPEEQYRSHSEQGPGSDVYALCATIYKLITGKTPDNAMNRLFDDQLVPPSELGARIMSQEETVLLKGMSVYRKDRYASMEELLRAFRGAAEDTPVSEISVDEEDDERTVRVKVSPDSNNSVNRNTYENRYTYESKTDKADVEKDQDLTQKDQNLSQKKTDLSRKASRHAKPTHRSKATPKTSPAHRKVKHKKKWPKILGAGAAVLLAVAGIAVALNFKSSDPYRAENSSIASVYKETVTSSMISQIDHDEEATSLDLMNCQLDDSMIQEISQMKNIKKIEFSFCEGYTTLEPLAQMESLESITVLTPTNETQNQMDGAALFPCEFPLVKTLYLSTGKLTSGSAFLANFPNLERLYLKGISGIDDLSGAGKMVSLTTLDCEESDLKDCDLSAFAACTQLENVSLGKTGIRDIQWMESLEHLKDVDLSENSITDISPLNSTENLRTLDISDNQISSLQALEGASGLYYVYAGGNQITDISPLSSAENLFTLELADNQISDLAALEGKERLMTLDLSRNQIQDAGALASCIAMCYLTISGNQLENLDFCIHMIDLKSLDARGNQIKDIEGLTNCTQLTSVTLSDNQITDISVFAKSADNLEILTLGSNQISSISALSGMTALKILSVENNQITSVASLADCTQLTFLAAYANQITDVDGLEKCSSLAYLDLGENQIRDISPLVTLSSKTVGLLLQNNQISDISMLPTQIRYSGLVLYNNPIQDFSVLEQMENVKSSDILYLSWYDNMDYIPVASSGYGSEVTFVDVPYDQMANIKNTIKEVKNSYVSTPEFCTLEEADEQIAEYRSSMQSQYHVD